MGKLESTELIDNFREAGVLSPQRMSQRLHLSLVDFARLARLHRSSLGRPASTIVQAQLEPIARILTQAEVLTGDAERAIIWFRHQPIAGHAGRTAQDLVGQGYYDAVFAYLEDLRDGAYT